MPRDILIEGHIPYPKPLSPSPSSAGRSLLISSLGRHYCFDTLFSDISYTRANLSSPPLLAFSSSLLSGLLI